MEEYQMFLARYKKYKRYEWNVGLFSFIVLILASVFVSLDIVRISPWIVYMLAMGIAIYYAWYTRVEGKNYAQLKHLLKKYDAKIAKDEAFVFFTDYQFTHSVDQKQNPIKPADWIENNLELIKNYYDYVTNSEDTNAPLLTMKGYEKSLESGK